MDCADGLRFPEAKAELDVNEGNNTGINTLTKKVTFVSHQTGNVEN